MPALALPTLAILLAVPVCIAVGQVLFKISSTRLVNSGGGLVALALDPVFLAALALYGGATVVWIFVLRTVPLAYAYSFMALTFVVVPLLSMTLLGEPLNWRYAAGAVAILGGLLIIQSS